MPTKIALIITKYKLLYTFRSGKEYLVEKNIAAYYEKARFCKESHSPANWTSGRVKLNERNNVWQGKDIHPHSREELRSREGLGGRKGSRTHLDGFQEASVAGGQRWHWNSPRSKEPLRRPRRILFRSGGLWGRWRNRGQGRWGRAADTLMNDDTAWTVSAWSTNGQHKASFWCRVWLASWHSSLGILSHIHMHILIPKLLSLAIRIPTIYFKSSGKQHIYKYMN